MKEPNAKRQLRFILPWVALLLLPAVLIPSLSAGALKNRETRAVREGVSVVERLAARDPAEVDRVIRAQAAEQRRKQIEAWLEKSMQEQSEGLEQGSIWEHFSDYVILGDSRAVGFIVYRLLDPSRIMAEGGLTIRDIPNYLDAIKTINPGYIYLCFGLNDAGIGYWDTAEEYAAEMQERIAQLKEAAPDARIIVSSILPATESAMERSPSWRKIPAFSEAVRQLCGKDGVAFADNDETAAKYMDTLWDEDGVHLDREFYPYWAKNLLLAAIEAEFEEGGEAYAQAEEAYEAADKSNEYG